MWGKGIFCLFKANIVGITIRRKYRMLLGGVFRVRESCISTLLEENVCDPQVLPRQDDTAETLAKSLQLCDMFGDIYITVSSKDERLNETITFGVVHS
jgi:hypothetical protein